MTRNIFCQRCGDVFKPMHPEDAAMGFAQRRVAICAKKPADHTIKTFEDGKLTNIEVLESLMCDGCGSPIPDGERAVAVTMWNTNREGEPLEWEKEYQHDRHTRNS